MLLTPSQSKTDQSYSRSLKMGDEDGLYELDWLINDDQSEIVFESRVRTKGWVGLGFGPKANMVGADIVVGGVKDGRGYIYDFHATSNAQPILDEQQDYELLQGYENDTHTVLKFKRKLNTCDENDWKIDENTVRLIWAVNPKDLENAHLFDKHTRRGAKSFMLMNSGEPALPVDNVKTLDITVHKAEVPKNVHTMFYCKVFELKFRRKVHMIKYEPVITNGSEAYIHHMGLFRCGVGAKRFVNEQTRCYTEGEFHRMEALRKFGCYFQLIAAYNLGGEAITFPTDTGYSLSSDDSPYVLLEVHYDIIQQERHKDLIDNSGFRLYLTESLQKYEIEKGLFWMGTNANYMIIPPGHEKVTFSAACDHHCTQFLPEKGVHFFNVQLHAHMRGKAIRMRHIQNHVELEPIVRDDYYDFTYQNNIMLKKPRLVLPNDTIIVECDYSSINATGPTFGGFQTDQEMCLIFVDYYPKSDNGLDSCIIGPSTEALAQALGATFDSSKLKILDSLGATGQNGLTSGPYGTFFNMKNYAMAMDWSKSTDLSATRFNVSKFQKVLTTGPQHQLCLKRGGHELAANATSESLILNNVKSQPYPSNFIPFTQKLSCDQISKIKNHSEMKPYDSTAKGNDASKVVCKFAYAFILMCALVKLYYMQIFI